MATAYASQSNVFVPSHSEESGRLIVDYIRNKDEFAINNYCKTIEVKKPTGYYLNITPTQAARVVSTSLSEWRWPDGMDAPRGNDNHKEFEYLQYATQRYAPAFSIGDMIVDHASWDILEMYSKMVIQQMMTGLSLQAATELTTSGNYSNTDTATNAGGGKFDVGTVTAPYFKKGLLKAAQAIHKATFGAVKPGDLVIVMSPACATLVSASQEVHSYLKESVDARKVLEGDFLKNSLWGLPPSIYGFPIVIEDAVYSADNKGSATTTPAYVLPSDKIALIARPGGLVGNYGAPDFSFLQKFTLEEFTLETKKDTDNRLTRGRCVSNYQLKSVAPAAGYLFTSATG